MAQAPLFSVLGSHPLRDRPSTFSSVRYYRSEVLCREVGAAERVGETHTRTGGTPW